MLLSRLKKLAAVSAALSKTAGILGSMAASAGKRFASSPVSSTVGAVFGVPMAAAIPGTVAKKYKENKQKFKPGVHKQELGME